MKTSKLKRCSSKRLPQSLHFLGCQRRRCSAQTNLAHAGLLDVALYRRAEPIAAEVDPAVRALRRPPAPHRLGPQSVDGRLLSLSVGRPPPAWNHKPISDNASVVNKRIGCVWGVLLYRGGRPEITTEGSSRRVVKSDPVLAAPLWTVVLTTHPVVNKYTYDPGPSPPRKPPNAAETSISGSPIQVRNVGQAAPTSFQGVALSRRGGSQPGSSIFSPTDGSPRGPSKGS